jgi:hypothetical protein
MNNQDDIDFSQIAPRLGSKDQAFECLCCQLGHLTCDEGISYVRLQGAGGDGGVECFADLPDGSRVGWQAKYVFNFASLMTQVTHSLNTALHIHDTMTRYIVCFPFDLTGKTARGDGNHEKFERWRQQHEQDAIKVGRRLTIEVWPAYRLRELLLQYDVSGGLREFFFNQTILTNEWFSAHLDLAKKTAGPRYTPELSVKTDLWKRFATFGRTFVWSSQFQAKLGACRKTCDDLVSILCRTNSDSLLPPWTDESRKEAESLTDDVLALLDKGHHVVTVHDPTLYKNYVCRVDNLLSRFERLESKLIDELSAEHGREKVDSPSFRQFMAEYMCSFPTANLDHTRDTIVTLKDLRDWLRSPDCVKPPNFGPCVMRVSGFIVYQPGVAVVGA